MLQITVVLVPKDHPGQPLSGDGGTSELQAEETQHPCSGGVVFTESQFLVTVMSASGVQDIWAPWPFKLCLSHFCLDGRTSWARQGAPLRMHVVSSRGQSPGHSVLASGTVINDDKGSLGSPTTSWLRGQRHAMLFVGLEMLKSELAKT